MIFTIVFDVGYLGHKFYIGIKKNRASMQNILALLNIKANYLLALPADETAAAQITRPNAILLMKSAKL